MEETRQANRQAFLTSEQAAETRRAGPARLPGEGRRPGPRRRTRRPTGALEEGDAIEAVDGVPTPDPDALDEVARRDPAAAPRSPVAYTRLGEPGTATVTTAAAEERRGVGCSASRCCEQPSAPFDVDIQVEDVGGPSAGLMLTLGILDLVGDDDLTGGAVIAGTGTIDAEGDVGPIGGIPLKMVAAREIGADLFLVPGGQLRRGRWPRRDPGFPLARVATLDDALDGAGRPPGRAHAGRAADPGRPAGNPVARWRVVLG